jgi:uncharacterized RDD family membrane protein YckC
MPPAETPAPAPPTGHDDELTDLLARLHEDGGHGEMAAAPEVGAELTKSTDVARPERAAAAIVESEGGIDFDPAFAGFGARAVGLIVDLIVLVVLLAPGVALIVAGSTALILLGLGAMLVGFAIGTVLYARAVTATGQSLGNRVAGTKVVDARNGRRVESGEAALRYFLRFTVSMIFFVGFVVALFDAQRRTFHDKIAGTVVTRPQRETWSIDDETPATRP